MIMILSTIILIHSYYFLIHILGVGTAIGVILGGEKTLRRWDNLTGLIVSIALGILFNSFEYNLAMIANHFGIMSHQYWLYFKLMLDWGIVMVMMVFFRQKAARVMQSWITILNLRENKLIVGLSLVFGLMAVIHYPHVHDCIQLIHSNRFWLKNTDLLQIPRILPGWGFSALVYYPTVIGNHLPMGSMAAGNKLILGLMMGLTAIYGINRLGLEKRPWMKTIYFIMLVFSYLGLPGAMILGKDSIWAALFSMLLIFSLISIHSPIDIAVSTILGVTAFRMGMISIPYLSVYIVIFLVIRYLPPRLAENRRLFIMLLLLILLLCNFLLPVKIKIYHTQPQQNPFSQTVYSYSWPLDGHTSFTEYFLSIPWNQNNRLNGIALLGVIGLFIFPFHRRRFSDSAVKSLALFLPISMLIFLSLTIPARIRLPEYFSQTLPYIPIRTKDLWDLIKDIPQWYTQMILGVFALYLIDTAITYFKQYSSKVYMLSGGITAGILALSLFSYHDELRQCLKKTYYLAYGGNKDMVKAKVLNSFYLYPSVNQACFSGTIPTIDPYLYWDIAHYFNKKNLIYLPENDVLPSSIVRSGTPFFLIAPHHRLMKIIEETPGFRLWDLSPIDTIPVIGCGLYLLSPPHADYEE